MKSPNLISHVPEKYRGFVAISTLGLMAMACNCNTLTGLNQDMANFGNNLKIVWNSMIPETRDALGVWGALVIGVITAGVTYAFSRNHRRPS